MSTVDSNFKGKPKFEDFYEQYYMQVLKYLLKKTGRVQDSEDLTSSIFVYCYEHYSSFNPEKSSVGTWLYMIVNSRFKNYCRDRRISSDYDELENVLSDQTDDMERGVWITQLREALAKEIKKLPERQQKIIILRYFYNKSSEEIAEYIGTTPGNVRVLISRSLDKMESGLKGFLN